VGARGSWVRKSPVICSAGSTQKAVLAAPPHAYSPSLHSDLPFTASTTTENPSPNPTPLKGISAKSGRPKASRSALPGRWLRVM